MHRAFHNSGVSSGTEKSRGCFVLEQKICGQTAAVHVKFQRGFFARGYRKVNCWWLSVSDKALYFAFQIIHVKIYYGETD